VYFIQLEFLESSMVAHTCNPRYSGGRERRILNLNLNPDQAKLVRPYLRNKNKNTKRAENMTQEVEHLPSK
jgi:hypothetical protein